MPQKYYAKILLKYSGKKGQKCLIAVTTFGSDESEVRENIDRMIQVWQDIKYYEVLKICTHPIILQKYVIVAILKYPNGSAKEIKLNTRAENRADVEFFFEALLQDFKNVVSSQIVKIEKSY